MATVQAVLEAVRAAEAAGASPQELLEMARTAAARFPAAPAASAAPPAPATAYRAKDGDVLDAVAAAVYGDEYVVLDLLAANPALADRPPHLAAGTLVGLPPVTPRPPERQTVPIWD